MNVSYGVGVCNALTAMNKTMDAIDSEIKRLGNGYTYENSMRRIELRNEYRQLVRSFDLWDDLLDYLKTL